MKSVKKNRRKALKAIAVSAPAVWAKPVVDSIVLPAHAATSCNGCMNIGFVQWNSMQYGEFEGQGRLFLWNGQDCPDQPNFDMPAVQTTSQIEAEQTLGCPSFPVIESCNVWICSP